MSDPESHERTYTIFHSDGPITLSEHELLNEYMRLRARSWQHECGCIEVANPYRRYPCKQHRPPRLRDLIRGWFR